jgi:hypothetical protein
MRDFSDAPTPLAIIRPRGARLIEARSPKLGRLVQHFDQASFRQWIRLEADPSVTTFCERPARISPDATSSIISYWVSRKQAQEFVMLVTGEMPADLTNEHDGKPLRVVTPPELATAAVWIDNWQRMLPVINCSANLVPPALRKSVLALSNASITLLSMERELARAQTMLVRAAVFDLLRTGALAAPSPHTPKLSLHTVLEPIQWSNTAIKSLRPKLLVARVQSNGTGPQRSRNIQHAPHCDRTLRRRRNTQPD